MKRNLVLGCHTSVPLEPSWCLQHTHCPPQDSNRLSLHIFTLLSKNKGVSDVTKGTDTSAWLVTMVPHWFPLPSKTQGGGNKAFIRNLQGFVVNKLNQSAPLVFVMKNQDPNIKYVVQRWPSDYSHIIFVNNQHIVTHPKGRRAVIIPQVPQINKIKEKKKDLVRLRIASCC